MQVFKNVFSPYYNIHTHKSFSFHFILPSLYIIFCNSWRRKKTLCKSRLTCKYNRPTSRYIVISVICDCRYTNSFELQYRFKRFYFYTRLCYCRKTLKYWQPHSIIYNSKSPQIEFKSSHLVLNY